MTGRETILQRIKRIVLGRPHPIMLERLEKLENDLIELRRDSMRIAELTDLVEDQLTPGSRQHDSK